MGSLIVPRSGIHHKFAELGRVALIAAMPIEKVYSTPQSPSKPPTVRKEFPETWIW